MADEPDTTARSELQSVGRTMQPPTGEEASAERLQTVAPWVWALVGVILVLVLVAILMVAGHAKKAAMPQQSPVYATPARRPGT